MNRIALASVALGLVALGAGAGYWLAMSHMPAMPTAAIAPAGEPQPGR